LRLRVHHGRKLVARASRHVRAGRSTIGVTGPFAAADHKLRVELRADGGGHYGDQIHVFAGDTLPNRLVDTGGEAGDRCQRIDSRRIDCETHYPEDEEDGVPCLYTTAHRLFRSGLTFVRPYGPGCHEKPMPFDRTPNWTGPWRAWPPH
jgi:hypothetical protein